MSPRRIHRASNIQNHFYRTWRRQPDRAAFNNLIVLRLTGPLDEAVLERALVALHARHPILSTVFRAAPNDEAQQQVIDPPRQIALAKSAIDRLAALSAECQRELAQPFDLEQAPPLRYLLYRLGADEHVLIASIHHILCDGWSATIFRHELAELYNALALERAPALPELPCTFGEIADAQPLSEARRAELHAHWSKVLKGVTRPAELPADREVEPGGLADIGVLEATVSKAAIDRLSDVAVTLGSTPPTLMMAAFQRHIHEVTGDRDVVTGFMTNLRPSHARWVMGPLFTSIPLRTELVPGDDTRAFVHRTFCALIMSMKGRGFGPVGTSQIAGTRRLVSAIQSNLLFEPELEDAHAPVAFEPLYLPGSEAVQPVECGLRLTVYARPRTEAFACALYDQRAFDRARIQRFVAGFEEALLRL